MNRYETNSKGLSPALSEILNEFQKMPRSTADETRQKDMDVSPFGIIPIECFLAFPNSDIRARYSVDCLSKNPTIKRMLSACSIELRTYVCRCSDLWEGWNNFITKGRSGKLNMRIPSIDFVHTGEDTKVRDTAFPYNPYHYMNIAPAVHFDKSQSFKRNKGILERTRTESIGGVSTEMIDKTGLQGNSFNIDTSAAYNAGVSALPAVMYCKIAKEYMNSNLLQENPYWYPENENHDLILPYDCTHASTASYDIPTAQFGTRVNSTLLESVEPTNDKKSAPWLNVLYNRQRKGNYFNTGSPFADLIRGDTPTLDVVGLTADFTKAIETDNTAKLVGLMSLSENEKLGLALNPNNSNQANLIQYNTNDIRLASSPLSGSQFTVTDKSVSNFTGMSDKSLLSALSKNTVNGIAFSMNEWRRLATMTVFRERMARTDGSYNQMIQAQFGHNPRWHEHSVSYCGGSYQPIVFSEVVQTSEDGASPLGTTAGRAVSSANGDDINIHTDDYSIVMTVMTITPDDVYCQGLDRMWTELDQADQYFPILNNLEPQAIKNKELFLTGTDSDDEDVFNYQERFSHFKSRRNQVSGLMALPINKVGDVGAYLFNNLFTSKPEFNNKFVTGEFSDNENLCFASTEQAHFCMRISSFFKYTGPFPYVSRPSDMGISY